MAADSDFYGDFAWEQEGRPEDWHRPLDLSKKPEAKATLAAAAEEPAEARNSMDAFLDGLSNCSCAQFAILLIAFVHREARVAARTLHRGIVPRSILRCSPRAIAEVYQGCENIRGHLEILHVRRSRMGRSDE